ncbi:MAG: MBL fold metallo-hydrolase [Gammaproteobacteria bacterium]|nr:MBL fold metallo-hydrolase [Gammaproteobacteria bacterium]
MRFGGPSDTIDPHASPETGSIRRIARHVWRIVAPNPSPLTGPGTNTYVVGSGRRIVIDPGPTDEVHRERILAVTGGRVDRILCTHSHPDHSPGAVPLKERTGAVVFGLPAPDDGHQDPTYAPDEVWREGATIEDDDLRLSVLHTPGHASNHVCLLGETDGLLFTGDHLMSGSTVVILPPDGSMRLYLESLRRLRTLPVRDLAPGHGSLINQGHAEIDRVVKHRLAREAKVVAALRARAAATLDEILAEVYDDVPRFMHPVARFSLLAHAIKLEEERRVKRDGETWTWVGE